MEIYLAADHGGFEFKQQLSAFLKRQNYEVIDCGNTQLDPNDDYPDFVKVLAQKMQTNPQSKGVVICRNGVGVSIAANRFGHLRCALGFSDLQVKKARLDDDINVLALGADYISLEQAEALVKLFLETNFSNLERHNRRLTKVSSFLKQE